jgi:hypothetical protein
MMKTITSKEFLMGVAAAFLILKYGDKLPVVGPAIAKIKV